MRKSLFVVAGLSIGALSNARAQDRTSPACPGGAVNTQQQAAQDACQQTYDIYQFLAPQLATVLSGGNATLGQSSTLGGFGHFSLGVRVNAVQGAYPQVDRFTQSSTGAVKNPALQTKDQLLPLPTADAAIGILGGIPLGITNILAVDALVSAAYIPSFNESSVSVTPSQNLQIGYGVRVGLLQESIVVPGVSLTYIKRDLPTTSVVGSSGNNRLNITNLKVQTNAWRLVASKNFLVLGLAAGVGQDNYDQSADISATVTNVPIIGTGTTSIPNTSQSRTRTNFFGDVSLNLPFFKIVGEAGQVTGGDAIATYNGFAGGRSDRSLTYFSAGIRLGF